MTESDYLEICIAQIEKRINRGKLNELSGHSFEQLSEDIYEITGIKLSGRTLRRLANGKINRPQVATKNALTKYLGYKNWEDFIQNKPQDDQPSENKKTAPKKRLTASKPVQKYVLIATSLLVVLLITSFLFFYPSLELELNKSKVVLQSNDIQGTPPHKASFFYDVSKIRSSNIFIDNDFYDEGELIPVKKNMHFYDKIFELPGYYAVKIIANGERLTCVGVHVISNDWSVIVNDQLYDSINPVSNNQLHLTSEQLHTLAIDTTNSFELNFRNIRDFDVTGDELIFETRFKNDDKRVSNCNSAKIEIINVHGRLAFNFVSPGCDESMLKANFGDIALSGEFNNLNTFRQDISYWRVLKIATSKKRVHVYLDDVQIYSVIYNDVLDQVKGLSFSFNGLGKVDYVKLFNKQNGLIYSEDFSEIPIKTKPI